MVTKNMKFPLVSVIIPVYNGYAYLNDCIDSVLNQSYQNIELFVVNDGSTDNSAEILESYGTKIQVITQKNSGQATARNKAAAQSKGDFFAFLDCDDLWDKEKIQRHINTHLKYPQAVASYCDHRIIDSDGVVTGETGALWYPRWSGKILQHLMQGNCIVAPSITMIKRDNFFKAGGFDVSQPAGSDDWQLWMHLAAQGPILYILETLASYRRHDNNMSSRWGHKKSIGNLHALLSLKEIIGKKNQPLLSDIYKNAVFKQHINAAWQHRKIGDKSMSIKHFIEAIKLKPYSLELWAKLIAIVLLPSALLIQKS